MKRMCWLCGFCTLLAVESAAQGILDDFDNFSAPTRIGSTNGPLAGTNILGQIFAGASPETLAPVGPPTPHIQGMGIIYVGGIVVAGILPYNYGYFRLVVWDSNLWGTSLSGVPPDQLGMTDVARVLLENLGPPPGPPSGPPVFTQPAIVPVVVPGVQLWQFPTAFGIYSSPAIGADGTLFVGSYDGKVYALNSKTGLVKWEVAAGTGVGASPALGLDGTVYVASGEGTLLALDGGTGAQRWSMSIGAPVQASAGVGADGTVYFAGENGQIYALDGTTGALLWTNLMGGNGMHPPVVSSPAIGPDGTVYYGSESFNGPGSIYALDAATGVQRWSHVLDSAADSSPAIGADGTVYCAGDSVYALDGNTGVERWHFTPVARVRSSPAIGPDGTVYVGSDDGNLYALDGANGTKRWAFATGGAVVSSPAISAAGSVYFGSGDSNFYALNAVTGEEKWRVFAAAPIDSSPVIATNGWIYVGTWGGKLLAIAGDGSGRANSAWPMFRQGPTHTGRFEGASPSAPQITVDLQSEKIELGQNGMFSVRVTGSAPLSFQWRFDGTNIPGATETVLRLTDVNTNQAGRYSVVVSNPYGSATSSDALVTVRAFQKWAYQTGGPISASPAIGPDGTVYAASSDGKLYALNGTNGSLLWAVLPGGNPLTSDVSVGADGTIYVGNNGSLCALNSKDGSTRWKAGTGGLSMSGLVASSPAIGGNLVYVEAGMSAEWPQTARVLAFDSNTGAFQWEFYLSNGTQSAPVIGPDGTVYATSWDNQVNALDGTTGAEKWSFAAYYWIANSPAIGPDGTIYVGSLDHRVYALYGSTGAKRWEFFAGGAVGSSPAIGPDGTVYVSSGDGRLYGLDGATGATHWVFQLDGAGTSPALGANGTVYIGSSSGHVFLLDSATGSNNWMITTGGPVVSSPAIGSDGTVYIGSYDGKLYALDVGDTGPAKSVWPMFRQNARRTGQAPAEVKLAPGLTLDPGAPLSPRFSFSVRGVTGQTYRVEATTNLLDWLALTNLSCTNWTVRFTDPQATNFNQRFYRLVTP